MSKISESASKRVEVKTIRFTTVTAEVHRCTPECFNRPPKPRPPNLRRISLGNLYESEGVLYTKFGDEWMAVVGLEFWLDQDGLHRMWHPAKQMHIHSPGGRTFAKYTSETGVKTNAAYLARESVKKLKKKGHGRQSARKFMGDEIAKQIKKAPKHKSSPKGNGRGAPGQPRSAFAKEVVRLRESGRSEEEAFKLMIAWSKQRNLPVAGPYRYYIKRRVHRWYVPQKKKGTQIAV